MERTKKEMIIHEAGHLLFTLKYIFEPSNINLIQHIHVDKNEGHFSHMGMFMPDSHHLIRVLGGAATEVWYNKTPYQNITKFYVVFLTGWRADIAQGLRNGYSWKAMRELIWKLSKEITDRDRQFIDEIVNLYKGNTKTVKIDKLIPVIHKFYPEISKYYERV